MRDRITIRLSDALAQQLDALAAQRGLTTSDVIRLGLTQLCTAAQTAPAPAVQPHTAHDCALVVIKGCHRKVRQLLLDIENQVGISVADQLVCLINDAVLQGEDALVSCETVSKLSAKPLLHK